MRVQVHLRAENLGSVASGSLRGKKSCPYAEVSLSSGGTTSGTSGDPGTPASPPGFLGRTEVVRRDLSPKWTTSFVVDHDENVRWTPLSIRVRDSRKSAALTKEEKESSGDGGKTDVLGGLTSGLAALPKRLGSGSFELPSLFWEEDPTMGEANVEVGEVLKRKGQEVKVPLQQGGFLYVYVTESWDERAARSPEGPASGTFLCRLRGLDVQNIEKGMLGLGAVDPYFELSKKCADLRPGGGVTRWVPVYRSEHIKNHVNPYWKAFRIDVEKLCHGDLERELKIAVWDYQSGGKVNRLLGECYTTLELLQKSVTKGGNANRENALTVMDEDISEEAGLVVVLKAEILE